MVLVILAEGKDADLFTRFSGIKFLWEENSGALGRGVEPSQSSIFMENVLPKRKVTGLNTRQTCYLFFANIANNLNPVTIVT